MRQFTLIAACLALLAALAVAAGGALQGGTVSTVAGSGAEGPPGDGGPATQATLMDPYGVVALAGGAFLIVDEGANRLRLVDGAGRISTFAGGGFPSGPGFGDGGPATQAILEHPFGAAVQADGGVLVADWGHHRVRRVAPDGTITTVAGNGNAGLAGDDGPAIEASLAYPNGVAALPVGGFLISDWLNHRIRRVDAAGTITTVAGTTEGFAGDGGPATAAQLSNPLGVTALGDGGYLITDHGNQRIRRVDAAGTITTLAGSGARGFGGDGGPATQALLDRPTAAIAGPDGAVLIADRFNQRIRAVDRDGIISTLAGTGIAGYAGDGGPALEAQLNHPSGLALTPAGTLLVADSLSARVRAIPLRSGPAVTPAPSPTATATPTPTATPGTGVAVLDRAGPIAVLGKTIVWSRLDVLSGRYELMTRTGTITRVLPVPSRLVPFDVDIGFVRAGRMAATYSRCRVEPTRTAGSGYPAWETGRGCGLHAVELMTGRQTVLRKRSSGANVFLPSVTPDRLVFARAAGDRVWIESRPRGGGRVTRFALRRGAIALDADGPWVAVVRSSGRSPLSAVSELWLGRSGRARRLARGSARTLSPIPAATFRNGSLVWRETCRLPSSSCRDRWRRLAPRSGRSYSARVPDGPAGWAVFAVDRMITIAARPSASGRGCTLPGDASAPCALLEWPVPALGPHSGASR